MSGPSLELEKPNAIGGLDKLVTNFAISAIAVLPTFLICIFMPWRVRELLDRDEPDGRKGMLLAPGAFFPLSLLLSFMVAGLLATPETLSNNGAFIGPGLALAVKSAASEGNIWKIIATIMPIYGNAILIGVLGVLLKPWAYPNWTLRVSLRAAFYVVAVLVSWMILSSAVIDLIVVSTGNKAIQSAIYSKLLIPTIGYVIWVYFWFFRNGGAISWMRSGALSLAIFGFILGTIWMTDFLMRL